MAKVIIDTKIYYKGNSQTILAGTEYPDNADIVKQNKDKFVFGGSKKVEPKKEVKKVEPKKEVKKVEPKTEVKKVEPKKEVLKEELLVEAPVAALKVTEEK